MLDHTHDPKARAWLASAQQSGCDFPIQNLPFGVLRKRGSHQAFRGAVAIGDQALDLLTLQQQNVLSGDAATALALAAQPTLNAFMAAGPSAWRILRHALFALLHESASAQCRQAVNACLLPLTEVEHALPARIGDYTDFYTSLHHALNVGRLLSPEHPLTPNFQWLPIAYHGRASSVVISGTSFHRPHGQAKLPQSSTPVYTPCTRLDYELEMGFFIGPGNALGHPIKLTEAEAHIFGLCLLNDWSARDHQFWEMPPLGPFLGKNFCTSISPWIVTLDALSPYRAPFVRDAGDPQPLPYLDAASHRARGGLDVQLSVSIATAQHRARQLPADEISRTSFIHQYWSIAQMLTQHTVGGCNLQAGDLLGTGTVSGPTHAQAGAIVELSVGGSQPITLPGTGEQRAFLHDGDTVILRGWCEREGASRIGFGTCEGTVLPALAEADSS